MTLFSLIFGGYGVGFLVVWSLCAAAKRGDRPSSLAALESVPPTDSRGSRATPSAVAGTGPTTGPGENSTEDA